MKITKQRLKQIIREELENVLLNDGVKGYIPDEDLDPETGARKDLGRKAAGDAGDWGLGGAGGRSKDHKARAAKHAAARAKHAAAEAAANPDNAPRLIPDEDLPPESRPRSLARKAVRAKMQAKKR